ncbi:AT-rich interactive domain-containing protein 4B isoform X2 [Mixophyes fleayi]|uniref:AT-rich interactive domain-containing protein 4B isoform X2 n=1 Tax=Mixophyes fleayi TaxID=3061075 RepID=UPI003F4DBDB6
MVTGTPLCTKLLTVDEQKGGGSDRQCPRSSHRHMSKAGNLNTPQTFSQFAVIMKSLDEPPFLSVGTDVSAKYRGAFCEAKIKATKRLVKVKVTFRRDATTVEVQDDHVKGPLKIGAVVEIKSPDGTYQEAIINKLTDASWYTVVFDDGDEKTLRRSSLCLKGERHFAESETLDQLPLTNPEHFGTPVIGKKTIRGRRSNHIPEEESSTSSSDEDEDEDKAGDELLGKVVCVSLNIGDKKKIAWVPALVVSPDCRDDIAVKKDFILIRSFKDGKFFSVAKTDIQDIGDISFKSDCILKPAFDHAMEFIRTKTIPAAWKVELKEESSSCETEDEEEETKDDQEDNSSEDEDEMEPFPGESENFLQQLYKFMEDRGTPINKRPVLGYRNLNLFKLFRLVHKLGGFNNIESGSVWKQVYQDLGIPVLNSAAGYNVKCAYKKYLYGFEEYCTSTNILFHMDLPMKVAKSNKQTDLKNKDFLKQETGNSGYVKEEFDVKNDVSSNNDTSLISEKEHSLVKEIDAPYHNERDLKGKDENFADKHNNALKGGEIHQKPKMDYVDDKNEEVCFLKRNNEVEEKTTGIKVEDNAEEEEYESYPLGLIGHVRFDEFKKADKIIRPADKSVPKIKHRRKIKNKMDSDHNRSKTEKDENCPKQCRLFSRPLFQPCDVDNESSFDSPESKVSGQGPLKPLEITSILNGLQATENSADDSETDQSSQNMNIGKKELIMSHITSDLTSRAEEKIIPEIEENYFSINNKTNDAKHSAMKQEESSDDTDSELESPSRKKFVKDLVDKVAKSQIKCGKRKLIECGKPVTSSVNDETTKCKETIDQFDVDTITSSDDEEQPKPKGSLIKKCNSLDDKKKALRAPSFYSSLPDVPDKRAKILNYSEERPRAKDHKDVWSSIQGQWPKKTLKELFSDSDTEGAASPSHINLDDCSPDSTAQPINDETRDLSEFLKPITDAIEMKPVDEKTVEFGDKKDFPSSGSNSLLNTPPTTPESTSSSNEYRRMQSTLESLENVEPNREEVESMKSETNSTIEVDSVTCELQDLQFEGNLSPTGFDASISSSSSNHLETESKEKGQKRLAIDKGDHFENCTVKKVKRSHKSSVNHKRKTTNTSDSEELSGGESLSKLHSSKSFSGVTSKHAKMSSGMSSPGKYVKSKERESFQKEYNDCLPKVYKWSFQISDLENMTSVERIAFLQDKLQELRKHYLSLKSEVASIDRRKKHFKKKEREDAVLSTLSSSPSSSSITAAVMLTLAEPSLSTSTQNAMVVECR